MTRIPNCCLSTLPHDTAHRHLERRTIDLKTSNIGARFASPDNDFHRMLRSHAWTIGPSILSGESYILARLIAVKEGVNFAISNDSCHCQPRQDRCPLGPGQSAPPFKLCRQRLPPRPLFAESGPTEAFDVPLALSHSNYSKPLLPTVPRAIPEAPWHFGGILRRALSFWATQIIDGSPVAEDSRLTLLRYIVDNASVTVDPSGNVSSRTPRCSKHDPSNAVYFDDAGTMR